jgi:hypothetical protein
MQKLHLTTFINAPREKVWDVMLGQDTYREWTKAFSEGARYEGNWENEGSEMRFLGPDPETGKEGGMVSVVEVSRKPEFVSLCHRGVLVDGEVLTEGPKADGWIGVHENYTFTEKDGGTELAVEMDILEEHKGWMEESWKKGLEKLKVLAEGR